VTAPDDYRAGFRTQREEVEDARLPVDGSLPDWLTGDLVGNGPGLFEEQLDRVTAVVGQRRVCVKLDRQHARG